MIGLNIPAAPQFRFLALVIDKMHLRGPSNEMRPQLWPKKTDYKVRLY